MTDFPDLKLKMLPAFPSNVIGGVGLEATKANGHVTLDYAWQEFGAISAIPTSPTSYILTYDTQNDAYVMVPSHLLGGAVAGISDAPDDGVQYGRQSKAWTPIIGSSGGTPAADPPLMDGTAAVGTSLLYARQDHVHPTDTTRAPINSPSFTGVPTTATTPTAADNSLKLATTAFVKTAVAAVPGFPEAPNDGTTYGRKSLAGVGSWAPIPGAGSFDSLSPTTTQGDIIYRNATTNTRLGASVAGYLLQTNGAGSNPTWAGFLQAGTGAAARTWQNKARDVIHAADFGVTANGSTDDTAAMNLALAAAAGKRLVLPSGLILLSSGLNAITASATYIEGQGGDSTKFVVAHATADIFTFSNVTSGGLTGCGFNASVTRAGGSYIQINNSQMLWISKNNFNAAFIGITRIGNSEHMWIENNLFSLAQSGTGIFLAGRTSNVTINGNNFLGSLAAPPQAAIHIVDASGIWMNGNDAYQCGNALWINPAFTQTVEHIFATSNAWDSGQQNGVLISNNGGLIQRLHFTGEWAATNAGRGILIQGTGTTVGISWVNGFIYNNGLEGLACGTGSNMDFSHNAVAGNGRSSPGSYDGLNIQPGIGEVRFVGNRCGAVDGYSNTQRGGIVIEGGAGNNILISNNDVRNNVTWGLLVAATGTANRVVDNIGYNPVGMANYTAPGSGVTYRAGPTRETHYLDHGSLTNLTVNGVALFYGTSGNTVTFDLGPNETYLMVYSSPPVCARTIH